MTPFAISTASARQALDPSPTPYFQPITPTLHVGYRKGMTGARWVMRVRRGQRYRTRTFKQFIPDDKLPADGIKVLSFEQIQMKVLNMETAARDENSKRACSFCKKDEDNVKALVAGPDCYICDACIEIGHSIVLEFRKNPERDWSNWSHES